MTAPLAKNLYLFGLGVEEPRWLGVVVLLCMFYGFIIIPAGALMSFVERKFAADLQARIGPNRAGLFGLLQPMADVMKLLQKAYEAKIGLKEKMWLWFLLMVIYSTVALLPLGSSIVLMDADMSIFLLFLVAFGAAFGVMHLGINQKTVPGWLGSARYSIQALAGGFPALISLLCVGIVTGGFTWNSIIGSQEFSPFSWIIFNNPFQILAFVVFYVSGLILFNVPPFDSGAAIVDLKGGISASLSGVRFGLFRISRFYCHFLWSLISVSLFCGAWKLPAMARTYFEDASLLWAIQLAEIFVLLTKTFFLMLLIYWINRVNPRPRVDHITDFSWRVLSPLALLALAGVVMWSGRWVFT